MDKKNINKIVMLTEKLNSYRNEYYNNSTSVISDMEYDKLFDELKELENVENYRLANSPTQTVGYEAVSELNKVEHNHPMLSLDKCHSVSEIQKFANGEAIIGMMKMDGLTVSARYMNGKLVGLETRGNGEIGNDILFHAKSFNNLPQSIDFTNEFIIDGEAIITYKDFEEINKELPVEEQYKNPRNLASGTLSLLDNSISTKRHLRFIAWDVVKGNTSNSFSKGLMLASQLGFTVVPYYTQDVLNDLNKVREDAREQYSYPIDGVVFKFENIEYGKSLGKTGHHFNGGIAYKYEDDKFPTKLLDVEWTMGKTGTLTPTLITEPIEIDGSIVERASVHNVSIFEQFKFTKDCTVYLYKANAIIPQCDSVENNNGEPFSIPSVCPICGAITEIRKPNDSEVLVCTNVACKGKLLGQLSHFVSKNAMDIDGMSEATLEFLIDKGWINCFEDIYSLKKYKNEWYNSEGFGKKSVDNLLSAIENSKNTTLDRFVYALSIPMIGRSASKTISNRFNGSYENFITACVNNFDFTSLDDFGSVMDSNIHKFVNEDWLKVLRLGKLMHFTTKQKENNGLKDLTGLTFVITGGVNTFKNRDEFKELVENLGGKVSGSVSAKTNYLVNNDTNSTSGKNKKANELGVSIISEVEFNSMIGRE